MKLVIFGLTVSSSWGNGHATVWRGLIREFQKLGHEVVFFEKDVPYYAAHRDLKELGSQGRLIFYKEWPEQLARSFVGQADVAMVTSYCPDAGKACEVAMAAPQTVFYDLDTGVTLERLNNNQPVDYLPPTLQDFDVVLSYNGGPALQALQTRLQARRVLPLYGSVDPELHKPAPAEDRYRADLSYLGTYAEDRHREWVELFLNPAREAPDASFLLAGSLYPQELALPPNVRKLEHVSPPDHPAFYCSARWTLNLTRGAMKATGYCPSPRLFEAAACGTPLISDSWDGLELFLTPGEEIVIAKNARDVLDALRHLDRDRIAARARERVLGEHTARHRALQLESALSLERSR